MSGALELSVQELDVRTDAAAWDAARLLLVRSLQAWQEGDEPIVYHLTGATLRIAEHIGFEGDAQRRATWLMQTIPRPGGVGLVYGLMLVLLYGGVTAGFAHALLPGLALSDVKKALGILRKAKDTLTAAGVNVPDPTAEILGTVEKLMAVITFSWLKVFWSGARAVLWGIASLIVPALIASIFSADAAAYISAHIPLVGGIIAAAFMGLGNAAMNAWKNWGKPAA